MSILETLVVSERIQLPELVITGLRYIFNLGLQGHVRIKSREE